MTNEQTGSGGGELSNQRVVVIGGGPAGLTAGYILARDGGMKPLVLEASDQVGGISRTEVYKGYRFDIGGHRFFTKVGEVNELWEEIGGKDFIDVPRSSRIYYRNKFYDYPLKLGNALKNLGAWEGFRIMASYAKWKVKPYPKEDTFEQWVVNRFGGRLYWHFFRTYTEKVWGIPCTQIRADWAAQRIKNLSLRKALLNALTSKTDTTSLISSFKYPRLGPGMMWETCRDRIHDMGGKVQMETKATAIHHDGNGRVTEVTLTDQEGNESRVPADSVINSMPLPEMIRRLDPPAPDHVLKAAGKLKYRDFLIVTLIMNQADPFPDNWIYIHSPTVKVGRIQNFRSWSKDMVPDPNTSSIGMEYFCHKGDGLWNSDDADLIELAKSELEKLGLGKPELVVDGKIIRQPKAYPVYDELYREQLEIIEPYVQSFQNLQTVGRNGMHRYNNQDHSMLTAILAARNVLGESHDVWNVNVERSYHEDFVTKDKPRGKDAKKAVA